MRILTSSTLRAMPKQRVMTTAGTAAKRKTSLKLSWEDIILAIALIVILVSWTTGAFSPEQVLAYLGFTATGGVWGYVSGAGSNR